MNINTIKISALAALAVSVLTAPSAMAQGFSVSEGDILVGFTQSTNPNTDYVIDLTKLDSTWSGLGFKAGTADATLTIGPALAADLTTAFGSSNPANLSWGLIGTSGSPGNDGRLTIYLSEPTGATPPVATSAQATQNTAITSIANLYGPLANAAVSSGGIYTNSNGLASQANSFTTRINQALGNSTDLTPIITSTSNTLDLYRLPNTNNGVVTDMGTISFNAATDSFTYSTMAPIPEPATALFGCAMLGAVVVARRRKTVVA
jgi:hypothetical protein